MAAQHLTEPGIPASLHDALLRAILENPDRAAALVYGCLPERVRGRLADVPPELVDGSFVDEHLRASQSDRLFRVSLKSGRPAFIHPLLEHKSSPDPGTPLQILGYMVRIWRRYAGGRADRLRALPPIIPVVLFHGRRKWSVPLSVPDSIDADEALRPFVRSMRYVLHDLGRTDLERLSGDGAVRAGLSALAASSWPDMTQEALVRILSGLPDDGVWFSYGGSRFFQVSAFALFFSWRDPASTPDLADSAKIRRPVRDFSIFCRNPGPGLRGW